MIDLFSEDVAVACMPGEFLDEGEQCPPHAHTTAGIYFGEPKDGLDDRALGATGYHVVSHCLSLHSDTRERPTAESV